MKELLETLKNLKQNAIKTVVDERIHTFAKIKENSLDEIFKELCFCIMTANCSAEKCIEIHEKIGNEFLQLDQAELAQKFKDLGYRFPNIRSQYIINARSKKEELYRNIQSNSNQALRDWIVKNIKGLGYKEASHFLRNIGFCNYAIIDFHIVDVLVKYNLVEKPKTMTKIKYLEIEEIIKQIGYESNMNMAELDLFLWYLETGKILK